jgi:hypothetical protein
MERRKHLRIAMEDLLVDVADGSGFFRGMVSDLSRCGICMSDLPKRLNADADKMTIVVSGKGGNFKMNVRPRWYCHGNARKSVGAEIENIPVGWAEFVMNFEPVLNEDVWGEIRL